MATLTAGTRLGPYEILLPLGAGGMGEVYRARDTTLERDVAVKILPASLATDAERLTRFRREARMLAALNHPNIGSIHGIEQADGTTALVMELVEGEDLSERIARGAIPLPDALEIASQIAEALEAAHAQGVVHRDLKPANIRIRPDGVVKVLDFGLAKVMEPAGEASGAATITSAGLTHAGVIVGTPAYMSPEQAAGRTVDRRTDVWAFGCVLYEMLSGRRAFAGANTSDTLASVLARDPDFALLPETVPAPLVRLLGRCLRKNPNERLRDIGDALLDLRDAQAGGDQSVLPLPRRRNRERILWAAACGLLLAAMAALLVTRKAPSTPDEMRLEITTPPSTAPLSIAISPDGRSISYVAVSRGESRLWIRDIVSGVSTELAGTEGAESPFWSPDSESLGFFADGRLKRIDVDSGSVQTLTNAPTGTEGTWGRTGVILFASRGTPISRISASQPGRAERLHGLARIGSDFAPHLLPDGRHFLYYVRGGSGVRGVYVASIDAPTEARRLLDSDTGAIYARTGHVLFVLRGTLLAQPFDVSRMTLAGDPFRVAEAIATDAFGIGVSVSDDNTIVYRARSASARQFVWFDRLGKELSRVGNPETTLSQPSLSRDDSRVVFYRNADGNVDVWMIDTRRGAPRRITSDAADEVYPVWSPDGTRIAFSSNRGPAGVHQLFQKSVAGSGPEELLLSTPTFKLPTDWAGDGRFILFNSTDDSGNSDIWALPLTGDRKPFPVVASPDFSEQAGQLSPDGQWIAYQSNESGTPQIYVQTFPGPGERLPVSSDGGMQVRWRRDGTELFYLRRDGMLMAAPFRLPARAERPEIGAPSALFRPPLAGAVRPGDPRHQYMVSADGQRILVATVPITPHLPISVILNWKPRR